MVFSSPEFLFVFLPLALLAFFVSQKINPKASQAVLFITSLVFYGWFTVAFVPLICLSMLFNFYIGQRLSDKPSSSLLAMGVGANLAVLAWFKYAGFFAEALNQAASLGIPVPEIILPLAISFFTFQQIAYLVDCKRGLVAERDITSYALFVTFFPQLIAGPIVHHSQMTPQFRGMLTGRTATADQISRGLVLITVGLFKKIVIADSIARAIDPAFASPETLTMVDGWIVATGYTLQIYFDFSGYCEMAMGLALLFGFELPINFNSPYKSRNVSEFWKRWHITLGQFLRDYLYFSLGGSKQGRARTLAALMATMVLGGFWHGAGWQFLLWGFLHGAFLIIFHIWKEVGFKLHKVVATSITMLAVIFAWVPFRAESLSDAITIWTAMVTPSSYEHLPTISWIVSDIVGEQVTSVQTFFSGWEIAVFLFVIGLTAARPNIHDMLKQGKFTFKAAALSGVTACVAIAMMGRDSPFIYSAF